MDGSLPLWELRCVRAAQAPGTDEKGLVGTEEGAGGRDTVSHY